MSIDEMMLRLEIAAEIEAISIEPGVTNALDMRIAAVKIAKGEDNYMTEWAKKFETQVDFE
jgi:hypothetical protein